MAQMNQIISKTENGPDSDTPDHVRKKGSSIYETSAGFQQLQTTILGSSIYETSAGFQQLKATILDSSIYKISAGFQQLQTLLDSSSYIRPTKQKMARIHCENGNHKIEKAKYDKCDYESYE